MSNLQTTNAVRSNKLGNIISYAKSFLCPYQGTQKKIECKLNNGVQLRPICVPICIAQNFNAKLTSNVDHGNLILISSAPKLTKFIPSESPHYRYYFPTFCSVSILVIK